MAGPAHLFRQTFSYAQVTGRTAYNVLTVGSISTGAARCQPSTAFIRDAAGESIQATYVLYTLVVLTVAHRVWLPGADTGSVSASRRILKVEPYVDGSPVLRFYKVWLQ